MAKRKSKKRSTSPKPSDSQVRNGCLDSLRGFAILLMIVDHVAGQLMSVQIEPFTVRFLTRLSMPLFCVIMGFLLGRRDTVNWSRVTQLGVATVAVNLAYYTENREVDILASLLVCCLLYALLGKFYMLLAVAVFLAPWDPTARESTIPFVLDFDYPVSLVAACVAVGIILRKLDYRWALLVSAGMVVSFPLISTPTAYPVLFLPFALALVALANHKPGWRIPGVEFVGRYPLTVYVTQYFVILALSHG